MSRLIDIELHQGMLIGMVLCGAGLIGLHMFENSQFDEKRGTYPTTSINTLKQINESSTNSFPLDLKNSEFFGDAFVDMTIIEARYYFGDDNIIYKEVTFKKLFNEKQAKGSAKFHLEGSVMYFDDVNGDKLLFPKIGEPIKLINEKQIEVVVDDNPVIMELVSPDLQVEKSPQ